MKRVAIVDDDFSVRRGVSRLLRTAGFLVDVYASGEEFLSSVADNPPCCLVLDIHLGGLSGLELGEEIRRMGLQAPIIYISAHQDEATLAGLARLGAQYVLPKPFDARYLLDQITHLTAKV